MSSTINENIITNPQSLPSIEDYGQVEFNMIEVMPQRQISKATFNSGSIDYFMSVSGNQRWVPSKSFFLADVVLSTDDAKAPPPDFGDAKSFCLAENAIANLISNIYCYAGNVSISDAQNYIGQMGMLQYRLNKTQDWFNSIGDAMFNLKSLEKREKEQHVTNTFQIMFVPPVGLFQTNSVLGAGSYRISLTPKGDPTNQAGMQTTLSGTAVAGTNAFLAINSLKFYMATFRADTSMMDNVYYLPLREINIQSKSIVSGGQTSLNFTLPSSTIGIAVFVQDQTAGSTMKVPPSAFINSNDTQKLLKNLQITFGNISKPSVNYSSDYDATDGTNKLLQRYIDTQNNTNLLPFSSETYADWLERGNLYYWNWVRPNEDASTEAQVYITMGTTSPANANIFVCAVYRTTCELSVVNGIISSVKRVLV